MRAFALDSFDVPPAVRDDLPAPEPAEGQALVRVLASAVNPVDAAIAAGALRDGFEYEFPVVIGRDFAGVVERAGAEFDAGAEVFGFVPHASPAIHGGSWAELTVAGEFIAAKPAGVSFGEAGAAPLSGMTALVAVDLLQVAPGESAVVIGATGGVGAFAVQLLARAGAHVIAPALQEDEDYLRGVGVSEVIDRGGDVVAAVRERHPEGVDALLDLVTYSPEEFNTRATVLREGGRAATPVGAAGDEPGRFNVMGSAEPGNAARLADLLEAGELRVPIQESYELDRAGEAMEALMGTHVRGKIGIELG
jgi:NADPH2:quinone reductase